VEGFLKMAAAVNVSNLFADLLKCGQNGDWDRALKAANKILQETPDDPKAFHCKVVCQIQLSKFQDALTTIGKNSKLSSELVFEKAYCQYRANQIKESYKTLQGVNNPTLKLKELKAQVLYRMEKYEECFDVYRDIIKNADDDYEEERETNLAAVVANLYSVDSDLAKSAPTTRDETFELSYNAACALIAQGNYKEAEGKLRQALDLCRKALEEDDVPDDEIETELGIIRVQLGFVVHKMGKIDPALKLYNQVLKLKPSDIGLAAVASNNVVCINKDQNLFDSKKKMKTATLESLEHKLTSQQRLSIAINNCLLLMYSNQAEQCEQQVKKLQQLYPECSELPLIQAALRSKSKQVDKAVTILQEYAAKNTQNSLHTSMVLVQLLLQQDRVSQACSVLQSLGDLSYRPGIVSALVSLYVSVENQQAASQILNDSVEWYKKHQAKNPELIVLWRESANFHIRHGEAELAAKRLEELRKVYPDDMKTLAQLITAYSQFDPKKALSISKQLPPVAELAKQVDVDALETTSWSMGAKYVKKSAKTDPSPSVHKGETTPSDALLLKKKKKKKKKKTKLPKNYDPTSPPDPERWLPRKERSTYKRRKDKRSAGIGKGTQGAVAGGDIGLDATKMQSMSSPRPGAGGAPSPNTGAGASGGSQSGSQGPRQQRKQPQQRKSKKSGGKGNKW